MNLVVYCACDTKFATKPKILLVQYHTGTRCIIPLKSGKKIECQLQSYAFSYTLLKKEKTKQQNSYFYNFGAELLLTHCALRMKQLRCVSLFSVLRILQSLLGRVNGRLAVLILSCLPLIHLLQSWNFYVFNI